MSEPVYPFIFSAITLGSTFSSSATPFRQSFTNSHLVTSETATHTIEITEIGRYLLWEKMIGGVLKTKEMIVSLLAVAMHSISHFAWVLGRTVQQIKSQTKF